MATDRLHLIHCEECIKRIEKYLEEGHSAFMSSTLLQDAVLWNLQLLSLCSKRVSDPEKERHPEIDWERAGSICKGLMDHDFRVDPERTWTAVQQQVPSLKHQLRMLLTGKM